MPKFNLGWLKDKNGEKFAPKTFLSQILNNDGSKFQKRVESIEAKLRDHDDKIVNNSVISDHESRITKNTSNISSLTTKVNNNTNGITENTNSISSLNIRVTELENQSSQTQFRIIDTVNGYEYIVEMQNGSLVSYSKCMGISVSQLPDNNSQIEILDLTGLIVEAFCEDNSTREITNYTVSDVENDLVTVTYEENGITYQAQFKTAMTSVKEALVDFVYTENADGTYTITDWKGTLNGEPSTEMIIPNSNLIIVEVD